MSGLLRPLRALLAPEGEVGIEPRLFLWLSLLGGLVSILVIVPANYIQGIFPRVSWLVFAFGLGSLAVHAAARRGRFLVKTLFLMLLGLLDLIWFGNGGSQGSIGMFFFTGSMYLVIFFRGRTRWAMLGLLLANGLGLLLLEFRHPALVTPFVDTRSRFLDLSTGFVICILVCILILWTVLAGYHTERAGLGRALEELRESEARFRGLYENTTDIMYWIKAEPSGDFVMEDLNPAGEALFRLRRPDVQGRSLDDLIPGYRRTSTFEAHRQCVQGGQPLIYEAMVDLGGPRLVLETLLVPVQGEDGKVQGLVGVSRDLTRSRDMEEALRQSQKLESLGVLAGGIAHDFNNLLAAMLGNLNLAQMKVGPSSPAAPHLDSVEKTVLRASDLTRQMLAYAGRGRFVVEAQDLNAVVTELLGLLRASIPKRVVLDFHGQEGLPSITADGAQIQQVVVNLVTNAKEAIGGAEGRINLSTRSEHLDPGACAAYAPPQALQPGPYVILAVEDTGCGMSAEVRKRIFEPFFTTKASGRGLGLSAILGILKGHGAGLRIWSEPGQGTRFELAFPTGTAGKGERPPEPRGEEGSLAGGKVLVVDDEEAVLDALDESLSALGYQVITARDGVEALELFRSEHRRLHFVLMDLSMPRMDGRAAFTAMQAISPGFPVILASGYDAKDLAEITPLQGFAGFLHKPFTHAELLKVLRLPPRSGSLS